jgi:flagellar biosynthesis/type III secretory pathway protein FliH
MGLSLVERERRQGIEQGIEQGVAIGRAEGNRQALLKLITLKYGAPDASDREPRHGRLRRRGR